MRTLLVINFVWISINSVFVLHTYDLTIYANCHCIPVFLTVNSPFYRCMFSVVGLDQFERPGSS